MPTISVKVSILKAHKKMTVGFEGFSQSSLERKIRQANKKSLEKFSVNV